MTLPFTGGIDSLENGTLILALAFALLHLIYANRQSARRTVAAAAPAALLAVLCFLLAGPILLVLAMLAAAAGEALLRQAPERTRAAARAVFGFALVFALVLTGQAAAGGFVPAERLGLAAVAWLVLAAGTVPALFRTVSFPDGPTGRLSTALRHAGAIAFSLAVLA